ncbi:MAG TPA: hypothetical protein VGF82_04985 [Terracidiphilus sp.]|jgi:hypothetical protein
MRHRISVLLAVALVLAGALPALATEGLEVTYLNGTVKAIGENARATLDTTSSTSLKLLAGQSQVSIPYNAVTTYEYREENRFRLGVLPTIAVTLLKARSKRHLVTIGWKDESGVVQTATFETTRDRAQGLEKVLEARCPQVCAGGLPWRRNHE